MAKQIRFTYDGMSYTLEFNRAAVVSMERDGFRAEHLAEKPASALPALFAGAFIMHHPYMKRDKIDAIYARMTNRHQLMQTLAEMYNEPIQALLEEPEENEGNLNWEER